MVIDEWDQGPSNGDSDEMQIIVFVGFGYVHWSMRASFCEHSQPSFMFDPEEPINYTCTYMYTHALFYLYIYFITRNLKIRWKATKIIYNIPH